MAKLLLDDTLLEMIYHTGNVRVKKIALSKAELADLYDEMKHEKYITVTDEGDFFLLEQGEKWDKVAKHYDEKPKKISAANIGEISSEGKGKAKDR